MSTVEAELRIHNGRTLARHTNPDDGQAVAGWTEMAQQSIRAINHLTLTGPLPAPTVYDVLGELKGVGHLLPQTLTQLARGLQQSLTELAVYDHAGDQPTAWPPRATTSWPPPNTPTNSVFSSKPHRPPSPSRATADPSSRS